MLNVAVMFLQQLSQALLGSKYFMKNVVCHHLLLLFLLIVFVIIIIVW